MGSTRVVAATAIPTPAAADYAELAEMRLPWDKNEANPRTFTNDWVNHWTGKRTATGLAWDFGRNTLPTPTPIANTAVLAPSSGYVGAVRNAGGVCNYGNVVDIQTERGWATRLGHLADNSGVRSEYNLAWIPRGVPIGNLGDTGQGGDCRWTHHIHLELLWHGGSPPPVEVSPSDRGQTLRLPANSRPFGVARDELRNPDSTAHVMSGNQETYRPVLSALWPGAGAVVPWNPKEKGSAKLTLLVLTTEAWSNLHEYRWDLRLADTHAVVASGDWQSAGCERYGALTACSAWCKVEISSDKLRRGQYGWHAQARFPDIRQGHENQWFTSDEISGRFLLLDLSNPFDWLRWQVTRMFMKPVLAVEQSEVVHNNPPPTLPPPQLPSGGLPDNELKPLPSSQPLPTPTAVQAAMAPEEVVRTLFVALDDQDTRTALGTLNPTTRPVAQVVLGVQQKLFLETKVDLDFQNLVFTRTATDGDSVVIRVTGTAILRNTEDGSVDAQADDYYVDVRCKKLLGYWYVDVALSDIISLIPSPH